MLASATPLFENVPGAFADPLGLADQQASGVVSLIVARYDEDITTNASIASKGGDTREESLHASTEEHGERASPPFPIPSERSERIPHPPWPQATYDTFVAASGGLVAVARTTPDYRFPVAPAAAVARFHQARDAGRPPALSLFAVDQADAARLLETTFYAECLKVHVDGSASHQLVADQLARCGCRDGLLEANDFSDPHAPAVRLVEVSAGSPPDLYALLDGVHGRVLLYDRAKNRAVAPDRAGAPLDLGHAIAEADRLARARRPSTPAPSTDSPEEPLTETPEEQRSPPLPSPADQVADDLRQRAERPAGDSGLSALVAELQGRAPAPTLDEPETAPTEPPASPDEHRTPPDEPRADRPAQPTLSRQAGAANPKPEESAAPHPLAPELDRLRTDAYALLEAAVGRDRVAALDVHVSAERDIPQPVPPSYVVQHLRALLLDDPPKRWHLFKRARAKTHGDVAALLLAFHAAHGHDPRPEVQTAVLEATQLWTRLHK